MNGFWSLIKAEPVLTQGVIQSGMALGAALGLHLSAEQTGAILAATAAILSLITRRTVSPTMPAAAVPMARMITD